MKQPRILVAFALSAAAGLLTTMAALQLPTELNAEGLLRFEIACGSPFGAGVTLSEWTTDCHKAPSSPVALAQLKHCRPSQAGIVGPASQPAGRAVDKCTIRALRRDLGALGPRS